MTEGVWGIRLRVGCSASLQTFTMPDDVIVKVKSRLRSFENRARIDSKTAELVITDRIYRANSIY